MSKRASCLHCGEDEQAGMHPLATCIARLRKRIEALERRADADRPAEPLESGSCACSNPACVWDRSVAVVATCPYCAFAFGHNHAYINNTYACPECGHGELERIASETEGQP